MDILDQYKNIHPINSAKFEDILQILKKIAVFSNINCKHAAALIQHNFSFSYGFNKYIKGKKYQLGSTIHAEIDVICNFPNKKQIRGMDIIVIRINKQNNLRNSRPCNDCILKLNKIGIRKVYYSNENEKIVYEIAQDMPHLHISKGRREKIK